MADNDKTPRLQLARIKDAVGLKGEVRVQSFTEVPEDFASYGPLQDKSGSRSLQVLGLRPAKGDLIVRFHGVADRSQAEALKGLELFVPRDRLGEIEDDETWYYSDLIGLEAKDHEGGLFGTVRAVQDFGAGDLLEITLAGENRTVLIPFTKEAVPVVDVKAGFVVIVPPEGLLDGTDGREDQQ